MPGRKTEGWERKKDNEYNHTSRKQVDMGREIGQGREETRVTYPGLKRLVLTAISHFNCKEGTDTIQ